MARGAGWCYKNGGKAPYGYQAYRVIRGKDSRGKPITKTLCKIEPEQAEAVRLILVELRLSRNLALEKIRDELNARGILPPRGRFWVTSCLFGFFRPERVLCYAGSHFWNKEDHKTPGVRYKPRDKWLRVDNAHPPIVTMEEAEAVIEASRRRATGRAWHKTDRSRFLLTGRNVLNEPLFVCTACGGFDDRLSAYSPEHPEVHLLTGGLPRRRGLHLPADRPGAVSPAYECRESKEILEAKDMVSELSLPRRNLDASTELERWLVRSGLHSGGGVVRDQGNAVHF